MTSQIDKALLDLDDMLGSLESAIDDKLRGSRSIAELRAELLVARDDVERLKAERDQLRTENKQLLELSVSSADKLDEAISAMQHLLSRIDTTTGGDHRD